MIITNCDSTATVGRGLASSAAAFEGRSLQIFIRK